jgi:hypothetical protein
LKKVVVFDNGGETSDRYTIIFLDGSYAGSSRTPCSPNGFYQHGEGVVWTRLDTIDQEFCHLTDKWRIQKYNKDNRHLGKYKTFNAMKRLPKQVLECIRHDVDITDVCDAIATEYYCQPRPRITEAFLREELGFGDKEIMLAQNYSGLIEFDITF